MPATRRRSPKSRRRTHRGGVNTAPKTPPTSGPKTIPGAPVKPPAEPRTPISMKTGSQTAPGAPMKGPKTPTGGRRRRSTRRRSPTRRSSPKRRRSASRRRRSPKKRSFRFW